MLPRDVLALARLFPGPAPRRGRWRGAPAPRPRDPGLPGAAPARVRARCASCSARLAEQHDVVLFIDDLQWGDVDSAALLADLLHPPRPPSLLLIACYRAERGGDEPVSAELPLAGRSRERARRRWICRSGF